MGNLARLLGSELLDGDSMGTAGCPRASRVDVSESHRRLIEERRAIVRQRALINRLEEAMSRDGR
jgi:hypothetical protein